MKCIARFSFRLVIAGFAFTSLFGFSRAASQSDKLAWPTLRIPNGIVSLPADLSDGVPFDVAAYYGLEDSNNREQLYLQVIVEYLSQGHEQFRPAASFFPANDRFFQGRAFQKRFKASQKKQKRLSDFIQTNSNSNSRSRSNSQLTIQPKDISRAKSLIRAFEPAFEKLKEVPQNQHCFFHEEARAGMTFITPVLSFLDLHQLRFLLDPDGDEAIDDLGIGLRLSIDLQPLGGRSQQSLSRKVERFCFEKIVRPMLESPNQTSNQLQRLITVLQEHRDSQSKLDPALEAARRSYLMSRHVYLDLDGKRYRDNPVNPAPNYSEVREINHVLNFMETNGSHRQMAKNLKSRWSNSARPKSEIDQVIKFAETLGKPKRTDDQFSDDQRMQQFIAEKINAMTHVEFLRDMEILKTRYREVEAACGLPFPKSTEQLQKLSNNWTLGNQWNNSAIFLWTNPEFMPTRAYRVLDTNAFLCVAAIKKWRLDHQGNNPSSLTEALTAVGVTDSVIDPFSGSLLNWKKGQSRITIYSVGRDAKDNKGKRLGRRDIGTSEFVYQSPVEFPKGDIVFEFKFSLPKKGVGAAPKRGNAKTPGKKDARKKDDTD